MNLLDPYEPPFKPKKGAFQDLHNTLDKFEDAVSKLEELNRPPVTEDYEDSPFADRLPIKED